MVKIGSTAQYVREDYDFPPFADAVRKGAQALEGPLFVVETKTPLWTLYLEGFSDEKQRQIHTCHGCRRFIEQYGALVQVDEVGNFRSVFWNSAAVPDLYVPSVEAMQDAVERARIVGAFFSSDARWGNGPNYDKKRNVSWDHFCVANPSIFKHALLEPQQRAAEIREEVGMIGRAISDFPRHSAQRAVQILLAEQLYRGEKVLGVAQWFLHIHDDVVSVKDRRRRDALMWREAATAPPGFAHVRSSMIGTLLEDLLTGDVDTARRKFAEKMHPLQYRRPTAAPTAGQIDAAEKVIAALNAQHALERRYARREDISLIVWERIEAVPPKGGGVFDHLRKPTVAAPQEISGATPITWTKFEATVLPSAERLQYFISERAQPFIALTTAAHADAPPMLQWDRAERRNPVAWYIYIGGAAPAQFGLTSGWADVSFVTLLPPTWFEKSPHYGEGAILVLEGAHDKFPRGGGGFFPEQLRSEYHGIRHTIEAHTRSRSLEADPASVAGIDLRRGPHFGPPRHVRVTFGGVSITYAIDRWD